MGHIHWPVLSSVQELWIRTPQSLPQVSTPFTQGCKATPYQQHHVASPPVDYEPSGPMLTAHPPESHRFLLSSYYVSGLDIDVSKTKKAHRKGLFYGQRGEGKKHHLSSFFKTLLCVMVCGSVISHIM